MRHVRDPRVCHRPVAGRRAPAIARHGSQLKKMRGKGPARTSRWRPAVTATRLPSSTRSPASGARRAGSNLPEYPRPGSLSVSRLHRRDVPSSGANALVVAEQVVLGPYFRRPGQLDRVPQLVAEPPDHLGIQPGRADRHADVSARGRRGDQLELARQPDRPGFDVDNEVGPVQRADNRPERRRPGLAVAKEGACPGVACPDPGRRNGRFRVLAAGACGNASQGEQRDPPGRPGPAFRAPCDCSHVLSPSTRLQSLARWGMRNRAARTDTAAVAAAGERPEAGKNGDEGGRPRRVRRRAAGPTSGWRPPAASALFGW